MNLRRFRSPDLFEPLHILFQAERADFAAYATAIARAAAGTGGDQGRARPVRGPGTHALGLSAGARGRAARAGGARRHHAGIRGGDAATAARRNCAEPVQTRYGVHLLRLDCKVEGQTLPFEQVHARIAAYLEESAPRCAVAQYVTLLLAGEATIAGCDMPAVVSPLVQ